MMKRLFCKYVKRLSILVIACVIFVTCFGLDAFLPISKVQAAGNSVIEQQVNILNKTHQVSGSASYLPSDNSLGIIRWDADKYNGETVYFEAILRRVGGASQQYAKAALFTTGGAEVSGSTTTNGGTSFVRVRSGAITLTDDTDYTVRICNKDYFGIPAVEIMAARLIIIQSGSTKITDTETQIEVGNVETETGTTATQLTDKKIYRYDSSQFTPAPTAYFEATMKGGEPPTIEQQVNILNKTHQVSGSASYLPSDNSLGIIRWDADKYNGETVYFEAILRRVGGASQQYAKAALFTTGGAEVSGSTTTNGGTSFVRVRSGAITLTDDTDYTVRICNRDYFGIPAVEIMAARLIVIQSDSTSITGTRTQIEVGNNQTGFADTTYVNLTDGKIYQYDQDQFSATPESSGDVEFHASLKINDSGDTVYAELYNKTDSTSVATLSHTGNTNWTLIRGIDIDSDADWDMINDDEYVVRIMCSDDNGGGCIGNIANAKIVLDQSDSGGITDVEVVHEQINTHKTDADTGYTSQIFYNRFNPGLTTSQVSFGGGLFTYYYEATLKASAGTAYAQMYNSTAASAISGSEVTTTNTSYTRVRSGDITSNIPQPDSYSAAQNIDTQLKNSATNTTSASSSWLIIRVDSLAASGPATAYADLYNITDATAVSGSEVSISNNFWSRTRSSSITLTTDKEYVVRMHSGISGHVVSMHNAKLVLDQSDAAVSKLELVHQYINTLKTDTDATYSSKNYYNQYTPANFAGGIFTYYFESTLKTSAGTGYARLYNQTDSSAIIGSEITTTNTGYTRVRSGDITANMSVAAKTLDTQLKNSATNTTSSSISWIIIQASDLENSSPDMPTIDNYNTGAWTSDNTPTLQFDLTDPDSGDILKYQIQIDNTAGFGSPEVDYTEGAGSAEPRNDVTYTPASLGDGQYYWRVKAIDDTLAVSDWAVSNGGAVAFGVDIVAPTDPSNLISTSHTVSVWSNDSTIDLSWTAGTDVGGSGVDGYSYIWDTTSDTVPDDTKDIEESVMTLTSAALSDGNSHYFHIRTRDNAGNWTLTEHLGPFYIDTTLPTDPSDLTSTSHTVSVWSSDNTVDLSWTAGTDVGGSGVDGYSYIWDTTSDTVPDDTKDIEESVMTLTSAALSDGNSHYFHIRTRDNTGSWTSTEHLGPFYIDTTLPTDPSDLTSTSHTVSVWSSDNTVDLSWTAGTDVGGSGVDGYSYVWDTAAVTTPDDIKDIEESVTILTSAAVGDGNSHYFHIRTRDNTGSWTSTEHLGPFYIDTTKPELIQLEENAVIEGNNVSIEVNVGDDLSGVTEYMISETPNFTGASWQPFTGTMNITLSATEGSVTLYFKFRDEVENESEVDTFLMIFELADTGINLGMFSYISTILLLVSFRRILGKSKKEFVVKYRIWEGYLC